MSSGKLFQTEFCQTSRCWLLNSLFSPNDLQHILFKFLIPNILNAMSSKENVNQNVSPAYIFKMADSAHIRERALEKWFSS